MPRSPSKISKTPDTVRTITVGNLKLRVNKREGFKSPTNRKAFLKLVSEGFTDKDAAALIGFNPHRARNTRVIDPVFKEQYERAREDGNDTIRAEIYRRAIIGDTQEIYHDGKVCGHRTKYSDHLIMFLAKSRMPEFRERTEQTVTHKYEGEASKLMEKLNNILDSNPQPDMIDITPDTDTNNPDDSDT